MPENAPTGDVFTLLESGMVRIGWDAPGRRIETTLRAPLIGEMLDLEDVLDAADEWGRGPEVDGERKPPTLRQALEDGPYVDIYIRLLTDFAVAPVEVDRKVMPAWLATDAVARRMLAWWRASPLSRREAVAATTRTP